MLLFTLLGGVLIGNGCLALFTWMGSPLIAMAGVLYVYHRESSSLAALEAASPVGRLALFYCRSALILGMNLIALPLAVTARTVAFSAIDILAGGGDLVGNVGGFVWLGNLFHSTLEWVDGVVSCRWVFGGYW